jgi:hypothetical protein
MGTHLTFIQLYLIWPSSKHAFFFFLFRWFWALYAVSTFFVFASYFSLLSRHTKCWVICLWWAFEFALILKHLQLCVLLFVFWFFLFGFATKVRTIGASSKAGNGNGISTVNQVHCSQLSTAFRFMSLTFKTSSTSSFSAHMSQTV